MGDGVTGVTRQKAEHEGDPLAGLTKRIRVMGMRDETVPGTCLLRLAQRGDRAFVKIRGGTRLTHSHTPHAVVARLSGRTV